MTVSPFARLFRAKARGALRAKFRVGRFPPKPACGWPNGPIRGSSNLTPVGLCAPRSKSFSPFPRKAPIQLAPLVLELPDGTYAAITEAALSNFSGMRLRAVGKRRVEADFTEGADGFEVEGEIVTPWRITLVAQDLNALVNSDLLTNLNPAPDAALYSDTAYIRAGRCVWRWWSQDTGTPAQEREFVEYAAALNFEFSLVDDGWKDWPACWDELQTICDLGRAKGVGVLVWKDYKDVSAPDDNYAQLRAWLDQIQSVGASGVKIDFMNAESKDKIAFQSAALRETARTAFDAIVSRLPETERRIAQLSARNHARGDSRSGTQQNERRPDYARAQRGAAVHAFCVPGTAITRPSATPIPARRRGRTNWRARLFSPRRFKSSPNIPNFC